ncbi:transglycosylase family protein [Candidatus Poriferisocius sp.]|uniref:transglycosylase family protein n=1 Tax=Candidatus Poriferisocius sp. TaxID=3101276 RepID=UPI003B02D147
MTVLFVAVVVTAVAAGGVAFGQSDNGGEPAQPVAVEAVIPPWRDLERAQQDLEVAIEAREAAQVALDRTVDELHRELARLDQLNDVDTGRQLLKDEAERLVVQEYMSGGDIEDLAFILEVSEATDALWRKALLSEVSEVFDQALDARENVPGERERTEARVRRLDDALPYLSSRLADVEESIEAAEWVVYIAEINDMAERERVENGFIEPTEQHWYNLRFCESTNNYTVESANGLFYGAYQFEPRTWRTVGGTGNPAHAPPEEQDARARLLYARRGDQPWPRDYCGRFLPRN